MTRTAISSPDLLATIVAAARRMVEIRKEQVSEAGLEEAAAKRRPSAGRFVRALRDGAPPRVIAECKRRSPSRGILREDYRPADHAKATPLLRKDFIVDRYQILEAVASGADAILLIVGALEPGTLKTMLAYAAEAGVTALVEVHGAVELRIAADSGASVIGVNSRNLRTLAVEPDLHEQLARLMPKGTVAVAESGLRELGDLQRLERAGYAAFLVGERLISQPDPGAALRALRGAKA